MTSHPCQAGLRGSPFLQAQISTRIAVWGQSIPIRIQEGNISDSF